MSAAQSTIQDAIIADSKRQGVSVIVTTYNRPDALDLVLESLSKQTHLADEIIIADDGSDEETQLCIQNWINKGLPVHHCWQADKGFRAGIARNRAVAQSVGNYLIFLDGDCVVFPDYIKEHINLAEEGWLVVGSRVLMSEQLTNETLNHDSQPLQWNLKEWLRSRTTGNVNRISPLLRFNANNPLRKLRQHRWQGAHSCNLGVWANDFISINGFDEEYQGWGHEDADLVTRLYKSGIKRKDGHYATPVLHLWHKIQSRDAETDNRHRLNDILSNKRPLICERGLFQQSPAMKHNGGEPLSATIITHNAEQFLDKCLTSLNFVDEIIIVDSGSTDNTQAIAEKHNATFISNPWPGFGLQKQFASDKTQHQWILSLDADEWVSEQLRINILRAMKKPKFMAYTFPRCNRFMNRWLRHGEGYPDYNLRLFSKDHVRWSKDVVHERLLTNVTVKRLYGDLMHESETGGLAEYLGKQNRYTTLQATALNEAGKRATLTRLLFNPLFRFLKFYFIRTGFRDGVPGLIHISIGCYNTFLKYAKLKEIQKK